MKTVVFFVSLMLMSLQIMAQIGQSMVTVISQNGRIFSASMNNGGPSQASTQVTFSHVQPGNNFLEVFRPVGTFFGTPNNVQTLFRGMIQVPANMQLTYSINNRNQVILTHQTPIMPHMANGGMMHMPNHQMPIGAENHPGMMNHPNMNMHGNMAWGMHPQVFQQLMLTISNTSFDSNRRNIAMQGISGNGVSSQQVLEIMRLMSFENTRLDIAKFAYAHTVDRQNYFIVNNGLSFNSSRNQLNRFIAQSF
jgi:hypothetical protein